MKSLTKRLYKKISVLFIVALLFVLSASSVVADTVTIQYGYDSEQQVTNVTYDNVTDVEYTYDGAGNRITKTTSATNPIVC